MPFSFSFIDQLSSGDPLPDPAAMIYGATGPVPDPSPWIVHEEPVQQIHREPIELPMPCSGGLAALAVEQSVSAPLAPPSRKLASYMAPGPAIAASLALAAQSPTGVSIQGETPQQAPSVASHFNAVQSLQSRDLAQLRLDLEREIEQVRQDLFGAAMGVSALKDRLDDLESTVVSRPPVATSAFSTAEVELLVRGWLDDHLPPYVEQAVKNTLDQAVQQTVSALSSSEFFRMPVHTPGLTPETILSQAPQILSSTLS
ncbi:hypothetical protein EI77_03235 [Prosthecobacter fusiformis]|uniref:Uncharacterized protein n=1 Tax=Prosthecobacter fusiformis TaxID=48464 RepID=A0A4R7RT24_9BACT|nr:hypothetical protein [Prosthecobacter fusiformis]TDU68118.1 hypothetical protein EI77_03235 [Prosthecobacter fusiformis]